MVLALALALLAPVAQGAPGGGSGPSLSGRTTMPGMNVMLYAATPGKQRPAVLGSARSRRGGSFSIRYRRAPRAAVKYLIATRPGGAAEAGYPVSASAYRLANALGAGPVPRQANLNERTTVAMAYAMAQFASGARVAGKNPGLRNAAAMTRNLVGRRGGLSPVVKRFPNGRSTETFATFNSLANLIVPCRFQNARCARLLALGAAPGGKPAADTFAALVSIARNPWRNVRGIYRLARTAPPLYRPGLGRGDRPDAWTLALRFEGVRRTMNAPGNIAFDAQGTIWVVSNYEYVRNPRTPACAGEELLRFTPIGRGYPESPYSGGGISGVGYGIAFDPKGWIWTANFGFAGKGCKKVPPRNSVSLFRPNGEAVSPDAEGSIGGGYTAGSLDRPQGIASDREGNIWIANCGNDSVTRYPRGVPTPGSNLGSHGLGRPFDIEVGAEGRAFVSSNATASIVVFNNDGSYASTASGHGIDRPMGIASDSRGYIWVSNSHKVIAPCGGNPGIRFNDGIGKGSVVLLSPSGEPLRENPIGGAGMATPWGIAVDGDDIVWVANFSGQRLSQVCGMRPKLCPPGKRRTGAAISPSGSGYGFSGLTRNTGVQVDPSGNVWLANNWKQKAIQTNPGGYQIVAYLGIAAPIKTPLIGPPERP